MPEEVKSLSINQIEIIKTLLYFDIFEYPLRAQEIYENAAFNISKSTFEEELKVLVESGVIFRSGDYYLKNSASEKNIQKRLHGNNGAARMFPTALEYSQRISKFPFVEGVCLSGALAKNYYDKYGDIDYFIITKPNRLWICRTLLILRYKLLSSEKKRYWCTNYFVSSNDLIIPDENVFTATELAYLIPTINYPLYKNLLSANPWYQSHFPNKLHDEGRYCNTKSNSFIGTLIEKLLLGKAGDMLDNLLLNITLRHWRKKYPELSVEDYELQFRSRKNVCKRHTKGYQKKILAGWELRLAEFKLN